MDSYPRPQNLPYVDPVLSNEGALSSLEAILQWTERKLAGPGRPGTVDGLVARWSAGRRSACLGRARCLAARGGYVNPASKGARWCPGASRRSIPAGTACWRGVAGKTRTHCAARMHRLETKRVLNLAPLFRLSDSHISKTDSFAGRGRREALGEGRGTELARSKAYRVERSAIQQAQSHQSCLPQCLAPHPKPSLRYGFDLSPQERGEVATISLVKFERCAERLSETCLP
jgi:hypothetical protein